MKLLTDEIAAIGKALAAGSEDGLSAQEARRLSLWLQYRVPDVYCFEWLAIPERLKAGMAPYEFYRFRGDWAALRAATDPQETGNVVRFPESREAEGRRWAEMINSVKGRSQ